MMSNDQAIELIGADRDFSDIFYSKIERSDSDGCWIWKGRCTHNDKYGCGGGYGCVDLPQRLARRLGKRQMLAHHVAWALAGRPRDPTKKLLHGCDTRNCCNPAHLHEGTCKENTAEMFARGRYRHGRTYRGIASIRAKLSRRDIARIRATTATISQDDWARKLGVHQTTIGRARRGQTYADV